MSLLTRAQSAAQTRPKSRTSKVEAVQAPGMSPTIQAFIEYKALEAEAHQIVENAKDTFIEFLRDHRAKHGGKSIAIEDGGLSVKVVPTNKFTLRGELAPDIREIMGESFDRFFDVTPKIEFNPDCLKPVYIEEAGEEISPLEYEIGSESAEKLGAAMANPKFFTITDIVRLKKGVDLDAELWAMPEAKRAALEPLLGQHKPQIKEG